MRIAKLACLLFLTCAPASAQSVQQGGSVTRNHVTAWTTNGVIQDGGTSADGPISSLGTVNNSTASICANSDHVTAAGRNQLCLGAQTSGPAVISLQNFGSAPAEGLQFLINGVATTLPSAPGANFVTANGPFTATDIPCFLNTSGTLQDCGVSVNSGSIIGGTWAATPIAVNFGGTGATTAAGARTDLGLGTMATQNASAVAITGGTITGLPTPVNPADAAIKSYVDATATGLTILAASNFAATTALPNSPTYNNGASGVGATLTAGSNTTLTVDGTVQSLNNVVLVNGQASAFQNGIYTVTTAGSGSAPWVLTRATYFNTPAAMKAGSYTFIQSGSANANSAYVLATNVATVGTSAVNFNLFSVSSAAGGSSGQIQFNNGGVLGGFTMSRDCTLNTATGAISCTALEPAASITQATAANNANFILDDSVVTGGYAAFVDYKNSAREFQVGVFGAASGLSSAGELAFFDVSASRVRMTVGPTGGLNIWNSAGTTTGDLGAGTIDLPSAGGYYFNNSTNAGLVFPNVATPTNPPGGVSGIVSLTEGGSSITNSNSPNWILDLSINNGNSIEGRHFAVLNSNWFNDADTQAMRSLNDQLQPGSIGFGGTWATNDIAKITVSWNSTPVPTCIGGCAAAVAMQCTVNGGGGNSCNGAWGSGTGTNVIAGYFNNQFATNASLNNVGIYSDPNDVIANFPSAGLNGFGYLTTFRNTINGFTITNGSTTSGGTVTANNPATPLDGPVGQFIYRQAPIAATFTASQSGTTLNVSAISQGTIGIGTILVNSIGVRLEKVTGLGTGTGGTGTYTTDTSLSFGSSAGLQAFRQPIAGDSIGVIQFLGSTNQAPHGGIDYVILNALVADPSIPLGQFSINTQCSGGGGAANGNGCERIVVQAGVALPDVNGAFSDNGQGTFSVPGTGGYYVGTNAGVSCNGSPTGSFQTLKGIVVHC